MLRHHGSTIAGKQLDGAKSSTLELYFQEKAVFIISRQVDVKSLKTPPL